MLSDPNMEARFEKALTLKNVLVGGFALACVLVASTYGLTNLARQSEVHSLQNQLNAEHRIRPSADGRSKLVGEDDSSQQPSAANLSERIAALEAEKQSLVTQLADISRGALSPDSELGGLINQLESDDPVMRRAAADGLFEMGDRRAISAIADYYWRDREEATRSILASKYFAFIWAGDAAFGTNFAIRVLEADNPQHSAWVYEFLRDKVTEGVTYENRGTNSELTTALESVALRSKDILVRTRAKLVLQRHAEWQKYLDESRAVTP